MSRILVCAEMTARDVINRRTIVLLLFLVPLTFYLARRGDAAGQSIRFACLGLAWAASTVSLFSTNSVKPLESRLRLAGHRTSNLVLGRLLALTGISAVVAGTYSVLLILDQSTEHTWAVAAALAVSVGVAVPLGIMVATAIPRDLEGMLVLIMIVGLQTVIDPAERIAQFLPLWGTRELITFAVDGEGDVSRAVLHALGYAIALAVAGALIAAWRLRRRGHLTVVQPTGA